MEYDAICFTLIEHKLINTHLSTEAYLLGTELGRAVQELSTDHWEANDVSKLDGVLETTIELSLKLAVVETEERNMYRV